MTTATKVTRGPNPMLEWRYVLSDSMALLGSRYGWPKLYFYNAIRGDSTLTMITEPERYGQKPTTKALFLAWCRNFEGKES